MHLIRGALAATGKFLIWRNSVGFDADAKVRYGLGVGSADLVGVHKPTGILCAWEIKTPTGRVRPEQIIWMNAINAANGHAFIVRSVEEAMATLKVIEGNR